MTRMLPLQLYAPLNYKYMFGSQFGSLKHHSDETKQMAQGRSESRTQENRKQNHDYPTTVIDSQATTQLAFFINL